MALTKTKKRKRRPDHFRSKARSTRKIYHQDFSLEQVQAFQELLFFDKNIFDKYANNSNSLLIGFDEVGRGSIAGPVATGAYSCTTFYQASEELMHEIKLARQVISDQLLNTNDRDSYYAETLCNDIDIAEDLESLNALSNLLNLEDSKKVSKAKRENLTNALNLVPCLDSESHLLYDINFESAQTIDEVGIVKSIWLSMSKNLVSIIEQYHELKAVLPQEIILLVDGPKSIAGLDEIIQDLETSFSKIKLKQIAIKKGDSKSATIAAAANIAKLARDKHMGNLSLDFNDYGWENNSGYGTRKHYQAIDKYGLTKEHRKSYLGCSEKRSI